VQDTLAPDYRRLGLPSRVRDLVPPTER